MLTCERCGGLTPREAGARCLHCDADLPRSWWWRMPALLGPVGAVLLAACYGGPGRYHDREAQKPDEPFRYDHDGDGARGPWECTPQQGQGCRDQIPAMPAATDVDCDDNDPHRFPGAADPDGDGIDQNCDGVDGWAQPNVKATPP